MTVRVTVKDVRRRFAELQRVYRVANEAGRLPWGPGALMLIEGHPGADLPFRAVWGTRESWGIGAITEDGYLGMPAREAVDSLDVAIHIVCCIADGVRL